MSFKKLCLFCSAFSILLSSATPTIAATGLNYSGRKPSYQRVVPRQKTVRNRNVNRRSSRVVRSTKGRLTQYKTVQEYLTSQNYDGLRKAVAQGLNIDAENYQGDTSLCTAIKRSDYASFSLLQSLGANLTYECVQKIPLDVRQAFITHYQQQGGYIPSMIARDMTLPTTNWALWGGIGGAAVLGTVVAVSAGGGGGGSSSGNPGTDPGEDPGTDPGEDPGTDPGYSVNAQDYLTREFYGTTVSGYTNPTNFLGGINAHKAYALMVQNAQPMAGEGVTVGVIDNAVDINHPDLRNNIKKDENGNVLGKNLNYGPCGESDTTNCWVVGYVDEAQTQLASILYDENGGIKVGFYIEDSMVYSWLEYISSFPENYDWDDHKGDPSPQTPITDHGTHVTGIIAAQRDGKGTHGVAFNADIVGVSLGLGWIIPDENYIDAFEYVVDNGAKVINNSWGGSQFLTDDVEENKRKWTSNDYNLNKELGIKYASVDHDAVTIFAAGNSGQSEVGTDRPQASLESAAPMVMPSLLYYRDTTDGSLKPFDTYPTDESLIAASRFVTVVSLKSDLSDLAFYSQRCGAASRWCIAVPGGEFINSYTNGGIVSTVPNDGDNGGYAMMQGTSMATPVVSGALATILGAAPSLKTEEAVAIMFETATDMGETGVDEIYGWGLVNLERALQPVGQTTLALGTTTTGEQVNFINTRLNMPKTFSRSLFEKLPENVVILDKYKRGYNVPVENMIHSSSHSKQAFADSLRSFTNHKTASKFTPSDNFSMSFSQNANSFSSESLDGLNFDMTYQRSDVFSVNFAFSQNAKEGMDSYFDQALKNPFTTSATDLYSLSNQFNLGQALKLGFGVGVGQNNFFDGNDRLDYKHEDNLQTGTVSISYEPSKTLGLNLSAGLLNEQDSILGLNGGGAFDMSDSKTYFMGAELEYKPSEKLSLSAAYYYGTSKSQNASSLLHLSDIESESVALKAAYMFDKKTTMGMRANSPLYIRKAHAVFDLPVARDATEDIIYRERITADLKSDAREWDFSVFGIHQMGNCHLQTEAMVRVNPEHQADVKNDYRIMFSFGFDY